MKKKQFGELIFIGLVPGVVIGCETKRKWTYYKIVFEDYKLTSNDFEDKLVTYEVVREDKLSDWVN